MEYCLNQLVYKTTDKAQLCQAKLLINNNTPDLALELYENILDQ